MLPKPKILVILGPTGSGKTALAIEIAKQFNGEVISADSRQVYKGLDIGTDKVTKTEMQDIPHHCIDVASPRRAYSAAQWRKNAQKAISGVLKRGKVPIVAGGTGYYIDILLGHIPLPEVPPNRALRSELEKLSNTDLLNWLRKLDTRRAETIEPDNKRRLIRAIEIAEALGKVPVPTLQDLPYDALIIGLTIETSTLKEKIKVRLQKWFRKGFLAEVRGLLAMGLSKKRINELGFEYRTVSAYLKKEISKDEMNEILVRELLKYVKKQKRWFRRNDDIIWIDRSKVTKIKDSIKNFLK